MQSFGQYIKEAQFIVTIRKGGPGGKDLNVKVMGKDKNDAVKQFRKQYKKFKNDQVDVSQLGGSSRR